MNIQQLQEEINRLQEELTEKQTTLPKHSIQSQQLIAIEELEEEIAQKQKVLETWKEEKSAEKIANEN